MTLAIVLVNFSDDQLAASAEKSVKDIQGVLEANLTTGIYDLILKVQTNDEHELEDVITKIKAISGVTSTMTNVIYKADSFAPSTSANGQQERA